MDPIRNITASIPAPQPRTLSSGGSAPVLPKPEAAGPLPGQEIQASSVEQRRLEAVKSAAENIANSQVLGTSTFVSFKDATGQICTRFRSSDGKVTYIPEPDLFKMSSTTTRPTVSLKA